MRALTPLLLGLQPRALQCSCAMPGCSAGSRLPRLQVLNHRPPLGQCPAALAAVASCGNTFVGTLTVAPGAQTDHWVLEPVGGGSGRFRLRSVVSAQCHAAEQLHLPP